MNDFKQKYRQAVEEIVKADKEEISFINRKSLETLQQQLGLSYKEAGQIESEVLKPLQERKLNKETYRQTFTQVLEQTEPISEKDRNDLKRLQKILELRNEDIEQIEADVKAIATQKAKLKQGLDHLKRLLNILGLENCHIETIKLDCYLESLSKNNAS
jgi:transketolase